MLLDSLKVNEGVVEIAKKAKAKGLSIGILSNHSVRWMEGFINKFGLLSIYDRNMIVISQEVLARKPSPKIYESLLQRIHQHISPTIKPNEVLFIDDKPENVEAAKSFGFHSFAFNNKVQQPQEL